MIDQNSDFEFYQTVGNNIKRFRIERGVEQDTLATMLSLTRASIINIEKGRQRPSFYQVWVIAQFLQVSIVDMLPSHETLEMHDDLLMMIKSMPDLTNEKDQQTVLNFVSAIKKPL